MKIKDNKLVILVLTCFILLLICGYIDISLNLPITPDNYIINDEVNSKPKNSVYRDQQIIWGTTIDERGEGLGIDSLGNIYITGNYLDPDMNGFLSSFDNNGNYRWNVTWGDTGVDWGNGIAIDSSDNIYVAGQWVNFTDTTAIILKYSLSGEYLGNITWGGVDSDAAYGIAIDSDDNIYITGTTRSFTIGGNFDIFLAKFNSSGGLEWNKTLPGSSQNDYGRDVALDSLNNVYIVGYNDTTGFLIYDIVVAKYDSEGNQIWNTTWGMNPFSEEARSISIDSQKNIYVTGYQQIGTDYNIKLIKFNSSGDYQWNETWDGGFINDQDIGWGVEVDSDDFIYVVGQSTLTSPQFNATLLKYNNSGDLQWSISWGGSDDDYGRGIAIDDLTDNIYITGITTSFSAGLDDDIFLLKFIEYPPEPFDLDSNAGTPDQDGNFTLNWTSSLRADNYSLYQYSSYITVYNGTLTPLIEETMDSTYPLTGYTNGTYYFIVKANNIIGAALSNCIKVEVGISPEEPDDGGNGRPIPGYNLIFLIVIIGFVSTIIIYRRLKLK